MSHFERNADAESIPWRTELAVLLAGVLGVKLVVLLLDPNLRLFMGDSASYLHDALTSWNPPDRSITYPELVYLSAVQSQSAIALVILQTVMGVVGTALVFWMLRCAARISFNVSLIAALLIAIEPSQLFYERMLMAESAGLLALLALVASTVAYVRNGRWRWAPAIAILGILAVSFRMSLLPVVIGLALLTPILRFWHVHRGRRTLRSRAAVLRFGIDCIVLAAAVISVHALYQSAYGARMDVPPTYMAAEGKMRIGLTAPLIRPQHLQQFGLGPDFVSELSLDLSDRSLRGAQIWAPDGLWAGLEQRFGTERADQVARDLSSLALQSDPLGLVRLGIATISDYFDDEIAIGRLRDDYGVRPPDEATLQRLEEELRYNARGIEATPGVVGRLFLSSRWWLTSVLFLLAPVAVVCIVLNAGDARRRPVALVIGFAALGLVAGQLLFSHIVSFRYLHPMPVFLFLTAALAAPPTARLLARTTRARQSSRPTPGHSAI